MASTIHVHTATCTTNTNHSEIGATCNRLQHNAINIGATCNRLHTYNGTTYNRFQNNTLITYKPSENGATNNRLQQQYQANNYSQQRSTNNRSNEIQTQTTTCNRSGTTCNRPYIDSSATNYRRNQFLNYCEWKIIIMIMMTYTLAIQQLMRTEKYQNNTFYKHKNAKYKYKPHQITNFHLPNRSSQRNNRIDFEQEKHTDGSYNSTNIKAHYHHGMINCNKHHNNFPSNSITSNWNESSKLIFHITNKDIIITSTSPSFISRQCDIAQMRADLAAKESHPSVANISWYLITLDVNEYISLTPLQDLNHKSNQIPISHQSSSGMHFILPNHDQAVSEGDSTSISEGAQELTFEQAPTIPLQDELDKINRVLEGATSNSTAFNSTAQQFEIDKQDNLESQELQDQRIESLNVQQDIQYDKMPSAAQLRHWHLRFGHMPHSKLKLLAKIGMISKEIEHTKSSNCVSNVLGEMTNQPWKRNDKDDRGNIRKTPRFTQILIMHHLEPIASDFRTQLKEKFNRLTIIVKDHLSKPRLNGEETMRTKNIFVTQARNPKVQFKQYQPNYEYLEEISSISIEMKGQITSHYQNCEAERRIRKNQEQTKNVVTHSNDEMNSNHRLPSALIFPTDNRNSISDETDPKSSIPTQDITINSLKFPNKHTIEYLAYKIHRRLQSDQQTPKRNSRLRIKLCMGQPSRHSLNILLILDLQSGLVSIQVHIQHYDFIEITKKDNNNNETITSKRRTGLQETHIQNHKNMLQRKVIDIDKENLEIITNEAHSNNQKVISLFRMNQHNQRKHASKTLTTRPEKVIQS